MHDFPLILASDPLMPIRILALIALIAVISAFIYVLLHLRRLESTALRNSLVPAQRGPRNNVVLIICAVPVVVVLLLLFLITKA